MVQWVNRSLVQAPRNGTTTHTVAFTAASAGNLLVAVAEGAVTSSTPTGWTLPAGGSAVNNTGLYVWYKTATAGEASFTTTHNGSNYPVGFLIYEFAAGSTFVKSIAGTGLSASAANPNLTGLTGTNLLYGAGGDGIVSGTVSAVWSGTGSPVEDLDLSVPASGTDGYWLGVAYVESSTATSFQPTATLTGSNATKEALTFAVNVATGTPVTTATGTTGVSVGLTGAATVLAVAAGSLALGLALSGTAVPVAVATGTLPVVAGLTGTASQTTAVTVTGALRAALSLTGTASVVATATGSLPLSAGLSGTGSVAGSYVTTGNLPLTVTLAGTAQTVTTVTGALPLSVGLTGSANVPSVPALTGTLPAALNLSGVANIVALTTGTLPLTVGLSGVGVNPSNEHDVTVTAALDSRQWASALTTRTNTGLLVQRSWEARLE